MRECDIRFITALVGLFFLIAIVAMPTIFALVCCDSLSSVKTEAKSCLAGVWIQKNHTPRAGGYGEAGAFRNGAALVWDHGDYIYALLGGRYSDSNRTLFYRYCISNNTWLRLTDTPHAQGAGDAITWANGAIYAMIGSRKHKTVLARYNCSNSSWAVLSLPNNWENETGDGASLVWTGGIYLYALQGEIGEDENQPITNFSRYNITNGSSGTWEDMHPIPEIEGVGDGASLLWIGNWMAEYANYIFALGGGSGLKGETLGNKSYTYCISEDEWNELE
jgi:hypothetical protein